MTDDPGDLIIPKRSHLVVPLKTLQWGLNVKHDYGGGTLQP
jgi:hypothetical protein